MYLMTTYKMSTYIDLYIYIYIYIYQHIVTIYTINILYIVNNWGAVIYNYILYIVFYINI